MKAKFTFLLLSILALSLSSCDNDETPKTLPVVSTSTPTNVTTSSATVGGEITDNGNDGITKSGVVYSSNVVLPTIDDSKIELTTSKGTFAGDIEGLSSGTTYHVRAFATNSIGTAYGVLIDFTTGNAAPTATEVSITGTAEVNKTLTTVYKYNDAENNLEGETSFQWYMAANSSGAGETAIAGATGKSFLILDAQNGKFLRVSVIPKATTGTAVGTEAKSGYTTAVGAETVTFNYNNDQVTYGVIISQATQRKWLDRNLGATRLAQSSNDYMAYGDLFQWGRLADGHQEIARANGTDGGSSGVTGTASVTSDQDAPTTTSFIVNTGGVYDWREPQNDLLWQGTNGANNPCPTGWRLATEAEWTAEGITNIDDGYAKLKLTYTGFRQVADGLFYNTEVGGYYWTSSIATGSEQYAVRVRWNATSYLTSSQNRGLGQSCRCIKD